MAEMEKGRGREGKGVAEREKGRGIEAKRAWQRGGKGVAERGEGTLDKRLDRERFWIGLEREYGMRRGSA